MIITTKTLTGITNVGYYDGSLIHDRFAYKFFKKTVSPSGNIIAFRAPMEVTANLIDLEDSMNNDYIYSDDAVNFCIEIPHADLFGAICFQRLFNTQVAHILATEFLTDQSIEVDGDDIMVHRNPDWAKCSVSIAAAKNGAGLIHTGINISAGAKAPRFAYSTNLSDQQALDFMKRVCDMFYSIRQDIVVAESKVII